jgi:WD40 repeat protein
VPPKSIKAEPDTNPQSRIVTLSIAVAPGSCSSGQAARSRKPAVPDECDIGSAYVVYWVHASGAKMGEPIVELPPEPYSYQLFNTPIPEGASAVMVVARNEHGQMPTGPSVKIVDNQSDKVAAWAGSHVFAAGTDGSLSAWKPADPSSRPSRLETAGRSITALVVDGSHGLHVVLGHDDGSVAVLDARDNVVLKTLTGNGRVTSLAFSGSRMQMVRGVKSGAVEWWDVSLGFVVAQLQGHTDAVTGLEAHWDSERLASASRDGTLRLWSLEGSGARTDASQLRPVFAPSASISVGLGASQGAGCFAISWDQERLLAPVDEAVHLFDLQSGERMWTLEGHSEPVRFVTMAWDQMRALSVAQDNVVKVWDLRSRECIFTLARSNLEPIRTVHVRWESMQAMAVLYDGTVALWDFQDADANFAMVPLGRTVRAAAVL